MKHYNHFFGVDVSKKTIDITHADKQLFTHRQFCNDTGGVTLLMEWLKEINLNFEETLFCMEATGLYCFPLTQFLATNSIDT
jgi:transposase